MTEILFPYRLSNVKSYHTHQLLHSHKRFVHTEANHWNYEKLRRIAGLAFGS